MIESPKSQGRATAKKTEAPATPAAPKNGSGRQQPNVSSEETTAATEAPLVFQPAIRPPSHAPFRLQHVAAVGTGHRCHPNTNGTSIRKRLLFRSAVQRLGRLRES